MRVLLDECVPWPLRDLLVGHDATSVQREGWSGIENGELLRRAAEGFDVFITADQGIRYPQNLTDAPIAIVELSTNDLRLIRASAPGLMLAISSIQPREYRKLMIQ